MATGDICLDCVRAMNDYSYPFKQCERCRDKTVWTSIQIKVYAEPKENYMRPIKIIEPNGNNNIEYVNIILRDVLKDLVENLEYYADRHVTNDDVYEIHVKKIPQDVLSQCKKLSKELTGSDWSSIYSYIHRLCYNSERGVDTWRITNTS